MAIESKTKSINGNEYITTLFPSRKGLALAIRLAKVIAPGLKGLSLDSEIGAALIGAAIGSLCENLEVTGTTQLVLELLANTRVNNQEIKEALFDIHYAGAYGELVEALQFVVTENFGSFFGTAGIGTLALGMVNKAA